MNKELVCPKCGTTFTVNEADYASIVNQVKNEEFNAEIERRMAELHRQHEAEQKASAAVAKQKHLEELSRLDVEMSKKNSKIESLKNKMQSIELQKETELRLALIEQQNKTQQEMQEKNSEIERLKADALLS